MHYLWIHICEKCINDKYCIKSNKTISNKKHDNHNFINYNEIKEKFDLIDELIQKYEQGKNYLSYCEKKNENSKSVSCNKMFKGKFWRI